MTEETQAAVETDGNDTAAVLEAASGQKTYLPERDAAPAEATEETPGDDAAAEADLEPPVEAKPKRSVQDRIDEVTAQKHEALREAEYWKAKALQAPNAQPAQEAQQQLPSDDAEPDPTDYEHGDLDARFIRDHATYHARMEFRREQAARDAQQRAQSIRSTYETRTKALYPEGKPSGLVAFEQFPRLPEAVTEIVVDSDIGPKIAEFLGDNPAEVDRLFAMSPIAAARELTRLESRLTAPVEAPKPTPRTATNAPEPPPQARGAAGRFQVPGDTNDFAAFEKQHFGR